MDELLTYFSPGEGYAPFQIKKKPGEALSKLQLPVTNFNTEVIPFISTINHGVQIGRSTILGAGNGLFVSPNHSFSKGEIITYYHGLYIEDSEKKWVDLDLTDSTWESHAITVLKDTYVLLGNFSLYNNQVRLVKNPAIECDGKGGLAFGNTVLQPREVNEEGSGGNVCPSPISLINPEPSFNVEMRTLYSKRLLDSFQKGIKNDATPEDLLIVGVATRDIASYEELFYSYGYTIAHNDIKLLLRNEKKEHKIGQLSAGLSFQQGANLMLNIPSHPFKIFQFTSTLKNHFETLPIQSQFVLEYTTLRTKLDKIQGQMALLKITKSLPPLELEKEMHDLLGKQIPDRLVSRFTMEVVQLLNLYSMVLQPVSTSTLPIPIPQRPQVPSGQSLESDEEEEEEEEKKVLPPTNYHQGSLPSKSNYGTPNPDPDADEDYLPPRKLPLDKPRIYFSEKYWRTTPKEDADQRRIINEKVYIKKSTIPNAGMGLFTKKSFSKNTIVATYDGDVITKEEYLNRPNKSSGFSLNSKYVLDGFDPSTNNGSLGRWMNDATLFPIPGNKRTNNTTFERLKDHKTQAYFVYIKLAKDLDADEEIFGAYAWKKDDISTLDKHMNVSAALESLTITLSNLTV